jgi:hypothetical protein
MSNYQVLTPESQDYLRSQELFNNRTYNTQELTIDEDMAATVTPVIALDGFGGGQLQGQITVDTASLSANMPLCTLPAQLVPLRDTNHPVVVLRAGAYVSNAVKVASATGLVTLLTQPQQNDIVCLDDVFILLENYK